MLFSQIFDSKIIYQIQQFGRIDEKVRGSFHAHSLNENTFANGKMGMRTELEFEIKR